VVLDNEHVFRISDRPGRWDLFDQQGPALVGSVVFGLCLGIAAGALTGSSFPAMVITFLGCQATRLTVSVLRVHYLPPLHAIVPLNAPFPSGALIAAEDYRGDQVRIDYQPLDRFWTFQVIEAAILLGLAAALLALAVWWARRRLA